MGSDDSGVGARQLYGDACDARCDIDSGTGSCDSGASGRSRAGVCGASARNDSAARSGAHPAMLADASTARGAPCAGMRTDTMSALDLDEVLDFAIALAHRAGQAITEGSETRFRNASTLCCSDRSWLRREEEHGGPRD